jgi:hypothetical protein
MKLKMLSGDVDWRTWGAKWISPKFNNGEFDYWLVLEFINFEEATGEKIDGKYKYATEVHCVAPSEVPKNKKERAMKSMGVENTTETITDEMRVELLDSYGISAMLYQNSGNNAHKLIKESREQINIINMMFGFFMDRVLNGCGNTGWDFIRGDIGFKRE